LKLIRKCRLFGFFWHYHYFQGKSIKERKRAVKETTSFIDNGDVGTNMPFTEKSLPPRARRKDCYFENKA